MRFAFQARRLDREPGEVLKCLLNSERVAKLVANHPARLSREEVQSCFT